jgi:hypothetical protein
LEKRTFGETRMGITAVGFGGRATGGSGWSGAILEEG